MLIPHQSGSPIQIHIPLTVIAAFLVIWTGITFWGSYLSARHVDYWKTELAKNVLELKVRYLSKQVEKSREIVDEVRQIEFELRDLLEYKNKYAIIANDKSLASAEGTGGPTSNDEQGLQLALAGEKPTLSWKNLVNSIGFLKSEANLEIASFDDLKSWIDEQRDIFRATPRGWPCPGHLSSHFGRREDPFSGRLVFHYGVDIAGPMGTPIRATADGRVRLASWHSGYGNLVVIEHAHGYQTRYAHNGRFLVKVGDVVKRGQAIALMGTTGKSSGPHCHYEVLHRNRRVNPYAYLNESYPALGSPSGLTRKTTDSSLKES